VRIGPNFAALMIWRPSLSNPPPPDYIECQSPVTSESEDKNIFAISIPLLGILLIIPLLGGLCAMILGVLVAGKRGKNSAAWRGLAAVAVVLGTLNFLISGYLFSLRAWEHFQRAPSAAVCDQFLFDLGKGDEAGAASLCNGYTPAQIRADNDQFIRLGPLIFVNIFSSNYLIATRSMNLIGNATATNGKYKFDLFLGRHDGKYLVEHYEMYPGSY
jgi:hypothetical protein